jgi:hypothetical protein
MMPIKNTEAKIAAAFRQKAVLRLRLCGFAAYRLRISLSSSADAGVGFFSSVGACFLRAGVSLSEAERARHSGFLAEDFLEPACDLGM